MSIDLFPGSHEANAFDKGVPVELANTASLRMTTFGLGTHVNNAVHSAAKTVNSTFNTKQLPHPAMLSASLVSNAGALFAAAFYKDIFCDPNVSFIGLVLQYGLNPDN